MSRQPPVLISPSRQGADHQASERPDPGLTWRWRHRWLSSQRKVARNESELASEEHAGFSWRSRNRPRVFAGLPAWEQQRISPAVVPSNPGPAAARHQVGGAARLPRAQMLIAALFPSAILNPDQATKARSPWRRAAQQSGLWRRHPVWFRLPAWARQVFGIEGEVRCLPQASPTQARAMIQAHSADRPPASGQSCI